MTFLSEFIIFTGPAFKNLDLAMQKIGLFEAV
jgi:hypothetical protein